MYVKSLLIGVIVVFFAASRSVALAADEPMDYTLGGYGFWQVGQVVKGNDDGFQMNHQWMNSALLGLKISAHPSERLHLLFSPEFKLYYPYPLMDNSANTKRANAVAYINDMNGTYSLGNVESPYLDLSLGVFTYKYNPDVKDLGEYMYRTGTYPQFMINDFDFAKARLCGIKATINPLTDLKFDVLFTSELQYYPLYDFSLGLFGNYTLFKAFNFGAGVVFARVVAMDNGRTSPTPATLSGPNAQDYEYITTNGDTAYYGFKSTKFSARANIDPKAYFPSVEIFGKEDLKLYGEIGILALPYNTTPDKTHPAFYNDLSRFMPMMVGFNFPAFKILDVLSAEIEYFPSKIPNSYQKVLKGSLPMPNLGSLNTTDYDPSYYNGRDVGWAFYAKKELVKGFSLIGQIAYDHMRNNFIDGSPSMSECLIDKGDWAWQLKAGYSF